MNKPIRTIAVFCLLLFAALMINSTWLQYVRAGELGDDPRNRRVVEAAFSRERGAIIVERDTVAESVPSDDKYQFQRKYPAPLKYAHLTGYFSFFSQAGIERTQNAVLSGDDSRLFVNRLVDLLSNAEPEGGSVQLTIDRQAQDAAYEGLTALGGSTRGAVVALEPSTGKILASVSLPTYDPNRLADHDLGAVDKVYKQLNSADDEPLLNRATQTTLPPGSTFKLVTAAAAIETGNYDADALVPGGASYELPLTSTSIGNGGRSCGTDKIPMTQAMQQSCNTTFLALADELGADKMRAQAEAFGFNSTYLDDLPMAQSVYPDNADAAQNALTGIGQWDVRATPLQMAMVVAGIANGGVVMKPYVVDEVRSPDLEVLDKIDPEQLSRAVESSTATELQKMLVATVESGTATPAAIPGVEVGGKTGTAESCDECRPYAWFVSFAKDEDSDREVAVAVMLEDLDSSITEIAGGQLGGPIAKSVMEAVMDQ
ncbi:peptidoglycan D,D-transpeptidase FtsI family protein [Nocardioides pacificus]